MGKISQEAMWRMKARKVKHSSVRIFSAKKNDIVAMCPVEYSCSIGVSHAASLALFYVFSSVALLPSVK